MHNLPQNKKPRVVRALLRVNGWKYFGLKYFITGIHHRLTSEPHNEVMSEKSYEYVNCFRKIIKNPQPHLKILKPVSDFTW